MSTTSTTDALRELLATERPAGLLAQIVRSDADVLLAPLEAESERHLALVVRHVADTGSAGVLNAVLHWIAEVYDARRVPTEEEGAFVVLLSEKSAALGAFGLVAALLRATAGDQQKGYLLLGRLSAEVRNPVGAEAALGLEGPVTEFPQLRWPAGGPQEAPLSTRLEWLFGEDTGGKERDSGSGGHANPADEAKLHERLRALEEDVHRTLETEGGGTQPANGDKATTERVAAPSLEAVGPLQLNEKSDRPFATSSKPATAAVGPPELDEESERPESGTPEEHGYGGEVRESAKLPNPGAAGTYVLVLGQEGARDDELCAFFRDRGLLQEGVAQTRPLSGDAARSLGMVVRLVGGAISEVRTTSEK